MIKSHVLYQLSYGLSHSTRALKAMGRPTSSATRDESPARHAERRPQPGYGATVM
jgi:hypothetical protein